MKYNHELVNDMKRVCKKHAKEDNDALYPLVAAGDEDARAAMITNNMPLVIKIVDDYLGLHPDFEYLRDDLTSAGFFGLSEGVEDTLNPRFQSLDVTSYLSKAIRHKMFRSAKHSPYESSDVDLSKRTLSTRCDSIERIEAQEVIESICESTLDKQLLALRREGYTFKEMSIITGIARRTLIDAFHAIRDRYESFEN